MSRIAVLALLISACSLDLAPVETRGLPCEKPLDCAADLLCHKGVCLKRFITCSINGQLEQGESCDDGNSDDQDGCRSDCQLARCGDGVLRKDLSEGAAGFEACDDANENNDDGCTNNCLVARCGDSFTGPNEDCDDGNSVQTDGCTNTCQLARCGDGYQRTGLAADDPAYEGCDDSNAVETDACTSQCVLARCGDSITRQDLIFGQEGFEACDDGNVEQDDFCLANCILATCGDGLLWVGREFCDDGNEGQTDSCLSDCSLARCGDGHQRTDLALDDVKYEQCDDGNDADLDDCRNDCSEPSWLRCGDRLRFVEQVLSSSGGGEGMGAFTLDLDGDDDLDVGYVNQQASAYTYLYNGNRSFEPGALISMSRSDGANDTGDIDGDGVSDLVVTHQDGGNLSVYRSNGGEALSVFSRLDFSGSPSGLKMADLDADGDLDLLVYNRSSSCQQVMLGDGEGGFQAGVCVDFSNVLALADVDTGGRPEVVSVANGNELQIHAIEEDFSFRFLRSVRVAGLGRIYRGAALDADGDEHIDLVVAGVFGDQSRVATLINNTQGVLINCNLSEPLAANPFLFADLDGDGGFDLISVAIEAQRTVYRVFWQEFPEQACGNGVLEEDERCDDGNTDDGDGCSAACISESDGVCTPERYDGTQMAALATTLWSCCGRGEHEYTPTTTSVTLPGDVPATALLLNQLESNYSSFNGWAGQRRWYEGHSIAVWAKPRNDGMACLLARFGPPSPGNPWHRQRATLCWDRRNQRISTWVQGREQHLQAANFGDAWVRLGFEADVANRRIQFFINGQRIQEHNYSQPGDDVSVALLSSTRDTGTTSTLFADLAIGLDRYEVCFPAPAENGGGG